MLPRWVGWALGVVVLACVGGLVLALALGHSDQGGSGSPTPAPDAAVLTAYTQALAAPTKEGGRIVQQEMKPSLADFSTAKLDGASFAARARGWQVELARVRDDIGHISPPPAIASAGPLFVAAMDAYVHAARLFEQAGLAPAAEQKSATATAIAAATQADNDFDRAALVVQRALAAAGLPADPNLPDVTPSAVPS